MDNNSEEFWEEYRQKLNETNDKWHYIDALIYRYRSPENLPIAMWSKKLDDNPNYLEEYVQKFSKDNPNEPVFSFDRLAKNPEVLYPYDEAKEEANWEYQNKGFAQTFAIINSRIERWQQKYKIAQDRQKVLETNDEGEWYTTPYAIIEKLIQNKFDEIADLPREIIREDRDKYRSPYCKWIKFRKILPYKSCHNKPEDYDAFCKFQIDENDDVSQNLRESSIESETRKYPDISDNLIKFRNSYPSPEIIDWRKK
jgi:hypothetical protein